MYDVNYFIEKFEAIPEDEWCIGIQQNNIGQRCAYGHCLPENLKTKGLLTEGKGHYTLEGKYLGKMFEVLSISPAEVNNGECYPYYQSTPKQRILAALYDIRDKELSEANVNAAKEIIEVEKIENVLV